MFFGDNYSYTTYLYLCFDICVNYFDNSFYLDCILLIFPSKFYLFLIIFLG